MKERKGREGKGKRDREKEYRIVPCCFKDSGATK